MPRFKTLIADARGATLLEFALLAPMIFGMMIGVLQIGIGMQAYNSLRSIASDTARYAAVSYQKEVEVQASDIETEAVDIATDAPYGLTESELDIDVAVAAVQRVAGATEFSVTIQYNVPSMISFIGVNDIPLTYSRPIFVVIPD